MRCSVAVRALLAGLTGALSDYAERLARSYARYLWAWQAYYAEETRWPDAPFWRRRQGATWLAL